MGMAVVEIGVMRVRVDQRLVAMPMCMRFAAVPLERMLVPVMRIVHVLVIVLHRLVRMLVLVPLGEMQPHAEPHQRCSSPKRRA